MRGITKLLLTLVVLGSALILSLITIDRQLEASEVGSSVLKTEEPPSTSSEQENELESELIDLTGMTQQQVAEALDTDDRHQNFIILNDEQLASRRGYKVTEIIAEENFSEVNSTMNGEYGVYKINGHYVFCIEPGYDTLNSAQMVTESGSIYSQFKESSQTYISRVISSTIGNYERTGHQEFIFAGQLLIWNYVSTNEAEVIGNAMESWNPDYLTSWTIYNSMYINQIQVIEEDLAQWSTLPSFLGSSPTRATEYTLDYNSTNKNFSITLVDDNKVWDSKYAWYGVIGNFKFSNPTGRNNLMISTPIARTSYTQPQKFTWNPPVSGTNELYDAGQDLIYVGAKPQSGYIKIKTEAIPKGGFELVKKGNSASGEQIPLQGVKFKVTSVGDNSFSHIYTTDVNGKISTKKTLEPGLYHITEISAPSDYQPNYEQDFKVNPGKVTEINGGKPIINNLYYNKIKFKKVGQNFDNNSTNLYPLKGVSFELYEEVGIANQIVDGQDKLLETLNSDQNGVVTSGKLYQGDYVIKEIATKPGYIVSEEQYPFKINNDGKVENGTIVDLGQIENDLIHGKVELNKVGMGFCQEASECGVPLAQVEFEIYSDANNNLILDSEEQVPVDTLITDQSGYAISNSLKFGHYFIKEIATNNSDYQLSETVYDFTIDTNNQIVQLNDGQPIINELYYNKIKFKKIGQNFDNSDDQLYPLSDVSFDLYKEQGEANQIIDGSDKLIATLTSNQQGIVESDKLYQGDYIIKESSTKPGYVVSDQQYSFIISNDGKIENGTVIDLGQLENDVIHGKMELNKVGVGGCQQVMECSVPLNQVEFEIYDDSNNNFKLEEAERLPIETLKTDKNGYAVSDDLKYGHYFIKETTSNHPAYKVSNTIYDFTIDTNNKIVQLNGGQAIINEEKTGKVEVYKRGESLSNDNHNIQFLNGAEYQILDSNDRIVDTLVTDGSGYASSIPLSFGKYSLVESKPPRGYVLDPSVYSFEINNDNYTQNISFQLSDQVIKNKVVINKIDSANGEELPGAELEVMDRNTNQVVEKWTSTDEAHNFEVNYGNYQICETSAPPGYKRLTECTDFDVTEDGVQQSFTLVNQRMKIAITGASSKRIWIIVLLVMIIILLACIYVRIYIKKT